MSFMSSLNEELTFVLIFEFYLVNLSNLYTSFNVLFIGSGKNKSYFQVKPFKNNLKIKFALIIEKFALPGSPYY